MPEPILTGNNIRERFLEFFESKGHTRVRSSSLVPQGDPTLLFTNAGMNQFKDVFLGIEQRDYKRATSAQKCVRAGGKHNDLENVGFTNRHHTFFEMLGNFSFGDYFKKEAIAFAWELVTSPQWFGIPKEKLFTTIFKGEGGIARDDEAYNQWLAQGVSKDRIFEFGAKDNFWAMGDTGPCGPCSEIHYDMGPAASDDGHNDCPFGCECGRYVEIWNLVFMQFNRDSSGKMTPLPKPCVDTGAGLERLSAVLQGKISNFDTDLFVPLIAKAAHLTEADPGDPANQPSLRIIADHFRAATFLIADGVVPSNDGRGYVLRKILRRAFSHARKLNTEHFPYVSQMAGAVRELMREPYPELEKAASLTTELLDAEERQFHRLTEVGLEKLDEEIKPLVSLPAGDPKRVFSGERAFRLYDTFGLPLDFITDVLRDQGIALRQEEFTRAMEEQRTRARASWKGGHKDAANPVFAKLAEIFKTEPDFYYGAVTRDCRIEAIISEQGAVNEIAAGADAEVVLDRTTFYAESGGQIADTGKFYDNGESQELAEVRGAYYPVAGLIAHRIVAKEKLRVGDRVAAHADGSRRQHIKRNHTATHLMHAALRNILGAHVKQAGSLVAPDHLRFDFSHFRGVDPAELREIELQVNEHILQNHHLATDVMGIDDALASGALAFFGDRYPESNVRVVTIPDAASPRGFHSKELCGGTHVERTGEIGVFKFVAEQSVASGVRRVEAITGAKALEQFQTAAARLRSIAGTLNVNEEAIEAAIERMTEQSRQLEKQLDAIKRKSAHSKVDDLVAGARSIEDVRVISSQILDADRDTLRQLVDTLRQKLGSGVVVLGTAQDGKVALIAGVTKDLTGRIQAGKIIQAVAKLVGGSGGGRPDLAEAGGKDTSMLEKALAEVFEITQQMLSSS
jgi:alanyl-tRNA synthetase